MIQIEFNGIKFTKDNKTSYYLNSTIRKRLHRFIWEYYFGEIPTGYHIHHKDFNKDNNQIDNLECISKSKHLKIHGNEKFLNDDNWFNSFHEKGINSAKIWHRSTNGIEWHKEHYKNTKDILHVKKNYICEFCKKEFTSIDNGKNKFCSNSCKSAFRREGGFDNEKRVCPECRKEFTTNRYNKQICCCRSCGNIRMWRSRRLEHGS